MIRTFDAGRGPSRFSRLERRWPEGSQRARGPWRGARAGDGLGRGNGDRGWGRRITSQVGSLPIAFHPDGDLHRRRGSSEKGDRPLAGPRRRHLRQPSGGRQGWVASCSPPTGSGWAALGFDGDVHLRDARTGNQVLVLRELWPTNRRGRLHPAVGLQPRRLPDCRNLPAGWWEPLGPRRTRPGLAVRAEGTGDVAGWAPPAAALWLTRVIPGAMVDEAQAHDITGEPRVSLDRARCVALSPRRMNKRHGTP